MKTYNATFITGIDSANPLQDAAGKLDQLEKAPVDNAPWVEFPYKPKVSFVLAYDDTNLYLKYYVEEQTTRALYTEINDPVFKDSCVEFFVSFNNEASYYNLEFNCLGTLLAAYRTSREKKTSIPIQLLQQVKCLSVIEHKSSLTMNNKWELTIVIPLTCFCFSHLDKLRGQRARANFYKCGDDLPQPHYLCWSPIITAHPDFHRPEFFGTIEFT